MPRNGSGVYSLPAGNPVVTATTIQSTWANSTLTDVASALTDSVPRDGTGGMTGALRLADGSIAIPGLSWSSETTTGFSRPTTNAIVASVLASEKMRINASGASVTGTFSASGAATMSSTLDVTGATTLGSTFAVTGAATMSSTLAVTGNVAVATNKFNVTAASGNTTIAGTLGVSGDVAINTNKFNITASSGNTTIAGTLGVTGDVAINTNKFNVTASSGNTTIAGTLGVTGAVTASGQLTVNNQVTRIVDTSATLQLFKDSTPTNGARLSFNTVSTNGLSLGVFDGSNWTEGLTISSAGNATVPGTLGVTGAATMGDGSTVSGSASNLSMYLKNSGTGGNTFRMMIGKTGDTNPGGFGLFDVNASAYRIAVNSSGNVGIATTSPSEKLEVNGTVKATLFSGSGASLTSLPAPAALSTASGSAPSYSARAWVNFNGTGTVATRGSGNVSSITDNGTGDYTVNFTTAMADTNYSALGFVRLTSAGSFIIGGTTGSSTWQQTGSVSIQTVTSAGSLVDAEYVNIAVFR